MSDNFWVGVFFVGVGIFGKVIELDTTSGTAADDVAHREG